jgi:hypothetical protein
MKTLNNIFKYFLITFVWIAILYSALWVKLTGESQEIIVPQNTTDVIKISPKEIIKALMFDIYFKNKNIEIINSLHSYMQSKSSSTSDLLFKYDLTQPLYLIHCNISNKQSWLLKGRSNITPYISKSPFDIYSSKTNDIYTILDRNLPINNKNEIKKALFQNNLRLGADKHHLVAYSIKNRKIKRYYLAETLNNITQIKTSTANNKERMILVPNANCFHVTSELNIKGILPNYFNELDSITDKLDGFSLNYYGASSNLKTDFLSPIPTFEMLLHFKRPMTEESLTALLRPSLPKDAYVIPGIIQVYYKNYYLKQVDSCTFYLSSSTFNKNKVYFSKASFSIQGQPKYLTEIRNLGIWETLLGFIPKYKATNYFFNSIEKIIASENDKKSEFRIIFKKNSIPTIELLRLFLALNISTEI